MFERFTDRARRALVLAQVEARRYGHSYIGTEHLLLGLIQEPDSMSAEILMDLRVTGDDVRVGVEALVPAGPGSTESPPFTQRAKKVLELSLREALQLGHNYIGTEHLLLGALREGEGIAAQVLFGLGVGLVEVQSRVASGVGTASGQAEGLGNIRWDQHAEVEGRSPADYARGFDALARMLAKDGVDLAEVDPRTIRISGIERGHVRGLQIAVKGYLLPSVVTASGSASPTVAVPRSLPGPAEPPLEEGDEPPRA
jgi:ATP-dependent Clp protease ATP-binding subunit ClpA